MKTSQNIIETLAPSKVHYINLLSHLFSDDLLIINARDSSSIIEDMKTFNYPIDKTIWIVGDNNWAQLNGFSGINNALASNKNLNFLIFEDETFSYPQILKKDLGAIAMTYNTTYVASVAIGANQEQAEKAFIEAEQHDGPSVIMAFSPTVELNADIANIYQYDKEAVNSGYWLLYRNDPKREERRLNTLQFDSTIPSIKMQDFFKMNNHFSECFKKDQEQFYVTMFKIQKQIDRRFDKYLALASIGYVNRAKLIQDYKIRQQLSYRKNTK